MNIKICGITRLEDALCAQSCGAWGIGYIFYDKSKRYIDPDNAKRISSHVDCEKIGVFVNSSVDEVVDVSLSSDITMIQLHGDENVDFISQLKDKIDLPIIKAVRVSSKEDIENAKNYAGIVQMLLFDTYSKKEYGGTGESFDWGLLNESSFDVPVVLSGGIGLSNIEKAKQAKTYAIDISSGVEISKGVKDHNKIKKIFSLI